MCRHLLRVALGCIIDGELRALGELRHEGDAWGPDAEAALTVEKPWQGHGIGTELVRRLVELASNRSIRTLHLFCLTENKRMQAVARKAGGTLRAMEGGIDATIPEPRPSAWSRLGEALADGQAILHAWWGAAPEHWISPAALP